MVGARVRFAGDSGVCPGSVWITSNWELALGANGNLRLQYDRVSRDGSYVVAGDELCMTKDAERNCHRVYRDDRGRIYLAGAEVPGPLPAMVTILR
jgi:hypothetical protein